MTGTTALVQLLETSRLALTRSVSDFSEEQWSCVPTEGFRCAAWIVGHAAMADRHVLEHLEEFGELKIPHLPRIPEDSDSQFQSRQEEQYITTFDNGNSVLTQFVKHRHALIAAVSQLAPDILDFPLDPKSQQRDNPLRNGDDSPLFDNDTIGDMIIQMALFTSQLVGEISMIRLHLGMIDFNDDW